MSTRLDVVLQKHPEHKEGIRLLASRDPSGNFKYLQWGAKVLASNQALAPEIADVVDLFHRFVGGGARMLHITGCRREVALRPDIHSYQPKDLAHLRDQLRKLKRAQDQKRRKRERLYRLEAEVEADVVYDSNDLIVRHIKNKSASVHYGLGTKWCISMLREGYFEDYEAANATFFFFERKNSIGDEFDKVALMLTRGREAATEAFTSLDQHVDMMVLAKVHGPRVFEVFRLIHERSESYPGSTLFQVHQGTASAEQCAQAFALCVGVKRLGPYGKVDLLESICCNDGASPSLLAAVVKRVSTWMKQSTKQNIGKARHRRYARYNYSTRDLDRIVDAALAIHPNTPASLREPILARLRRRHIDVATIHRVNRVGRIEISYGGDKKRGSRRHPATVKQSLKRAEMFDRLAARYRKRAETLQRKLDRKKKNTPKSKKGGRRGHTT